MGIMDRLLGKGSDVEKAGENSSNGNGSLREGIPVGMNQEEPVLAITETAKEKIVEVLSSQSTASPAIRISSGRPGKYAMSLEADGNPAQDDTVLPYHGFQVFVDPHSLRYVEGASLDYVETFNGAGFQFTAPKGGASAGPKAKPVPEGPEGDIWRRVQEVLDTEVNPAVASHGGHITLIEVKDDSVYVQMSGGCQGCGSAAATLKMGVERLLREHVPGIQQIIDVTDHAGGSNPYYS